MSVSDSGVRGNFKKLLLFLVFLPCATSADQWNAKPAQLNEKPAQWNTAFALAQAYVRAAGLKAAAARDRRTLWAARAVAKSLSRENLRRPPPGADFKYCTQDSRRRGFTTRDALGKPIPPAYFCRNGLKMSTRDLAQTMIHEAAHQGIPSTNECLVTFVELTLVQQGGGIPFQNDYFATCPFQSKGVDFGKLRQLD